MTRELPPRVLEAVRRLRPSGSYRARLNRYHKTKDILLPLVLCEQHAELIRLITDRLKV